MTSTPKLDANQLARQRKKLEKTEGRKFMMINKFKVPTTHQ